MSSTQSLQPATVLEVRQLKRLYRAGLLALLLIAAIVAVGVAALEYSARWVQHTREVLRAVRELQTSLLQVESRALQSAVARQPADRQVAPRASETERLATGTTIRDTAGYRSQTQAPWSSAHFEAQLARLLTLTADNPSQQERARMLAEAVNQWAAQRAALLSGATAVAIDTPTAALQQVLKEFQQEESNLYSLRVARQQRWRVTLVLVVLAALTLVAFALHRMTSNVLREAGNRRRVEGERDRAQALLNFALERSPLAVAVLEPDDSLRVANDAWRALEPMGRSHAAQAGLPLADELAAVVERVRRTGEPAVAEVVVSDARAVNMLDREESPTPAPKMADRILLASAHRIDADPDAAIGLVLLDVSEQRWLETQLRHAQRMESLGRLASGVAHDINNVVTAIMGFADMAIAGVRSPDALSQVDNDLQQVRRAADRAAVMAKQLLAFSRRRIAQERPLDLSDVVRDIEPMLRRILGSHVQFEVRADSQGWAVRADPGQIEQVLLNLAINARDAMERGGDLTVTVHTADRHEMMTAAARRAWPSDLARSDDGCSDVGEGVCLTVRDTGGGIPPAVLSRMFEPFFTTKAEEKGTGLGLATVRQIVDSLGGFVTIHSKVGEGTSLSVYLPRTAGDPEPLRIRVSRTPVNKRSGMVLVAEDDRDVRYLMEHVLSDAGYTVHTARNGREALSAIERASAPYQLLITDLVMPAVGGVGLGSHAIVEERVAHVLYISGYQADSFGEQTTLPQHARILAKPFTPADLLAAVAEAME